MVLIHIWQRRRVEECSGEEARATQHKSATASSKALLVGAWLRPTNQVEADRPEKCLRC